MTKEELENYRGKFHKGNELYLKIEASTALIVSINELRFSKDMENLLRDTIKSLILQNTANFDGLYFTGNKFAKIVLDGINIDAITNETLKNILKLVQAKKAELENEFEDYKI